jgi:hypothetical protein
MEKHLFNPFEGRDPDTFWAEIRKQKGPKISREEAMRQMKALSDKKK